MKLHAENQAGNSSFWDTGMAVEMNNQSPTYVHLAWLISFPYSAKRLWLANSLKPPLHKMHGMYVISWERLCNETYVTYIFWQDGSDSTPPQ